MTFPSLRRQRLAPKLGMRLAISSTDSLQTRAENIVSLLMLRGEQPSQDAWIATVRDVLQQYAELDRPYDPHLDSKLSYDAAIAALRAEREAK
jgi:hypothetical protein